MKTRESIRTLDLIDSMVEHGVKGIVVDGTVPEKARILLQLALTEGTDPANIKRIFNEY
jgi:L-asparaginase/Glu-tRNA(Gln) amidotransferase subunit D